MRAGALGILHPGLCLQHIHSSLDPLPLWLLSFLKHGSSARFSSLLLSSEEKKDKVESKLWEKKVIVLKKDLSFFKGKLISPQKKFSSKIFKDGQYAF